MIVVTNEVNVSICGPRRGLIYSNHYKMKLNYILFKRLECESGKKIKRGSTPSRLSTYKRNFGNHNRKQYSGGGGDNKQYYCISINCI